MARERKVTRTFEVANFEVMVLNVETCEVSITEHKLPSITDEEALLKRARFMFETDTFKVVKVTIKSITTELRAMDEEKYYFSSELIGYGR